MEMIMDPMSLSIADPASTRNEALKICKIRCAGGDAFWSSKDLTETPFIPSCYDMESKSSKLGLDLLCNDEYFKIFISLDSWCVDYLITHSPRLFGERRSREWVQSLYKPCVRKSGSFDPLLRTKIIAQY